MIVVSSVVMVIVSSIGMVIVSWAVGMIIVS